MAAAQTAMPDPLDDRSVKRLDKMEKVVRELRAIVFQGRDTGKPVVVQAAETDAQIAALSEKLADLEQTLTKLNGQNEGLTHDLDEARGLPTAESPSRRAGPAPGGPGKADRRPGSRRDRRRRGRPRRRRSGPDLDRSRRRPSSRPANCCWTATTARPSRPSPAMSRPSPTAPRRRRPAIGWARPSSCARPIPTPPASYLGAVRGWPQTSWAPDAVLKLSRSLVALKKPADACKTLDELARRYPKAPAASPPGPPRLASRPSARPRALRQLPH
jgi:TolA-binding protein